jgi:hypothetical protein
MCVIRIALLLLILYNTTGSMPLILLILSTLPRTACVYQQHCTLQTKQLPGTGLDDAGQLDKFGKYDFSDAQTHFGLSLPQTVATLNGAHTVGKARVTPKSPTNVGIGAMSSDPNNFNGIYYTQVMSVDGYKGL